MSGCAEWEAGGIGVTKWAIRSNHGGGYQFRLCPRSAELTEECMQQTPLPFASQTHRLEFIDGTNTTIAGHYVSKGTMPAGSTWAMVRPLISPISVLRRTCPAR